MKFSLSGSALEATSLSFNLLHLRTSIANVDHLSIEVSDPNVSSAVGLRVLQWFPSNLSLRDLNRLLSNFERSIQEIIIKATEPITEPSDVATEIGGKAVELRIYIDPSKDNDPSLRTQSG